MQPVQRRLFRQAALDRLSSPEELEGVMTVAPARSWIALAAVGLLLAAALTWSLAGRLRVEATADGACGRLGDPMEAIAFVRAREARQLAVGAQALVLPGIYDRAEYGYINGAVTAIGAVASRDEMRAVLDDDRLVDRLAAGGPVVAVRVRLSPDPATATGVRWTASSGPAGTMVSGVPCAARLTVAERRPITLVVPALQRIFGE
jgi:hypothetical protein